MAKQCPKHMRLGFKRQEFWLYFPQNTRKTGKKGVILNSATKKTAPLEAVFQVHFT